VSSEKSWHTIFDAEFVFRKSCTAELASFERHKTALLDILRKAHAGGPKSKPFDEQPAWRELISAAAWYFRRPIINQKTLLPGRRVERLRELAKALRRAQDLAQKAVQDDVGIDLFRGWCAETKRNIPPSEQELDAIASEITQAVAALAALKAAADRAAQGARKKAGRPSGAGVLSMDDIITLKRLFQRSTGREPRAGPFVQLVEEFLVAVGRADDTKQDYVVEALKYADKQARKQRAQHANNRIRAIIGCR
jgi:hypothetical protein